MPLKLSLLVRVNVFLSSSTPRIKVNEIIAFNYQYTAQILVVHMCFYEPTKKSKLVKYGKVFTLPRNLREREISEQGRHYVRRSKSRWLQIAFFVTLALMDVSPWELRLLLLGFLVAFRLKPEKITYHASRKKQTMKWTWIFHN